MKTNHKITTRFISNLLISFVLIAVIFPAKADTPEGWVDQQAELVSPKASALLLEQRQQTLTEQRLLQTPRQTLLSSDSLSLSSAETTVSSAMTATAEYSQLAVALENDPRRIYQFIRNHFKYEPYYGALKGAFLTLKERSGNDFDQAALLVELLRAAGYTANYQYGTMDIPHASPDQLDTAHWLGSEVDANVVGSIIATGGIPATNYIDHIVMDRVWVVANINGTSYALDPAFKPSTSHNGIDLATAMAYDQTTLLNSAGGLVGTNSIESLNNTSLNNSLNNLTAQLLNTLKQNYPNAHLHDIVGGFTIIPDESNALPTSLPYPVTTTQPDWTDIPSTYVHTVRLQHGGIDTTLNTPEIAGKKLSIQYAGDSIVIDPPPVGATNFGSVAPGQDGITNTWSPGNPNSVVIQVTSIITGVDASAFIFTSGGGTQNIPANNGTVDVKVKFTGQGQTAGRKNATLNFNYSYQGSNIGSQTVELTGAIESTPVAKIYLDDTLLIDEVTPTGNQTDFIISIDHPYAGSSGTFADQSATFVLNRTGSYVLASGFGGDRNSTLIAERQRQLDQMLLQGLPDNDPKVLTETLNIMGQNWFKQTQLNAELLGLVSDRRILRHHRFGMVGQEEGYFIDVKAQFSPTLALTASAAEGAFQASGLLSSAMEHSVLEQLQGADKPAISTVKIFNLNNQNGDKFFLANQANFSSIQGQLTGYSENDISKFQNAVNNNGTLILPKNGQLTLNQWSGKGYVDYRVNGLQRSLGMIIGGGLNGGFLGEPGIASGTQLAHISQFSNTSSATSPAPTGADPVDLGSGAYLDNSHDLSLGGSGARGLSFGRSYNSQQVNKNKAYMGPGWSHSYTISVNQHSDLDSALGKRSPQDAAALLVSAFITRDLMQATQPSLKSWVVSALIAQWATDQLLDRAVSVNLGDHVLTYRQQPDGSFTLPPGVTTDLVKQGDGTYQLQERFGTVLTFNAVNKLQTLTDIDGNSLVLTYTGDKLTQVKDTYNRTLTLGYTGDLLTQVSDNQGRSVSYGYTGQDLTSFHNAENKQWQYGYDSNHQILSVTDPVNVIIVDNTYDEKGRVVQQRAPRKTGTALYKLHYTGLSSADEDPQGNRTTYSYDFNGRTIAVEDAQGHHTKTTYDGQGHGTTFTDSKGRTTTLSYDGSHNLIQSQDALNQLSQFTYDSQHRLTRAVDALSHASETDFDAKHRPLAERDALNNQSTASYRTDGLINTLTDARGTTTSFSYGNFGLPTASQTGAHPAIQTSYDAIGRLQSLTDRAGATTAFSYDKRSLVTENTDPLLKKTLNSYNDLGQLVSQTDRNGDVITTGYTSSRKLETINFPARTASGTRPAVPGFSVNFAYEHERDLLTSMTDPLGSTSNSYDNLSRLSSHTDPNGFQVQYQYDEVGNLTQLTYPDGKTVSYQYDTLDRVSNISVDWLNVSATPAYDIVGRLTSMSNFNGSSSQYSYDAADRLTGLSHTINGQTATDYQFTLDANGNRTKAIVSGEFILPEKLINQSHSQTYNSLKNRLLSATINNETKTFSYDDEGQTESKTGTGNQTNYVFDAAHRVTAINSNTQTASFEYDGAGNRLGATRNGQTTKYVHDAAGNVLAEADSNGNILRYYIHGLGVMAMVENTQSSNSLYVYHHDATGHTIALTDNNQQVINRYSYDPYGKLMAKQEQISQPYTYAGQAGIYSEADNLYYMRARYYDAEIGRFISEDPAGLAGGLNQYAYAGGNPVSFIDPSGLGPEGGGIGGALLDFGLGFIPGYDLYQAVTNPNATGVDIALGAISAFPGAGKAIGIIGKLGKATKNTGRLGKQKRLRDLANDDKASSADRGWIKNEIRHIKNKNRKTIRLPRNSRNSRRGGSVLAHKRGKRAKDGYGYDQSVLQDTDLHKLEHKHGGY